jgi:hypothetical protein
LQAAAELPAMDIYVPKLGEMASEVVEPAGQKVQSARVPGVSILPPVEDLYRPEGHAVHGVRPLPQ